MTNILNIQPGTVVLTWDGYTGSVLYRTKDGWYGVRLLTEQRIDEWQPDQLEVVP